ncbi:hypothetical protein M0805_008612 [Coniferiporia weirii]|nr:hypothetical protein M0805_008612 [Coniferiporia weirii]
MSSTHTIYSRPSIHHGGPRVFHNYPGARYLLPGDEKEIERLKFQHTLLKTAFEDRILLVPLGQKSSYFVLDCGVGPAAWLHPPNVSFSVLSVTELPQEWAGRFDIIHQRLLIFALRRDEWTQALKCMLHALCPGGWVQFTELGIWRAGLHTERHRLALKDLSDSQSLFLEIVAALPELLREAGFFDIRTEMRAIPLGAWAGQFGIDARNDLFSVFQAIKTAAFRFGRFGSVRSEEDFDELMDAMGKEWDRTEGATMEIHTFLRQEAS